MLGQQQAINQAIEQQLLTAAQAYEDHVDQEIQRLENLTEDDIEDMRRKRMAEMKRIARQKEKWRQQGHGEYSEVKERDVIYDLKSEDRLIVHFYRSSEPCNVIHKHLEVIAKEHLESRIVKVQAEQALFLAEKLSIQMLPTILVLHQGALVDRVAGLDQLGGSLDFPTWILAQRLGQKEGLFFDGQKSYGQEKPEGPSDVQSKIRKGVVQRTASDEDSDFGD